MYKHVNLNTAFLLNLEILFIHIHKIYVQKSFYIHEYKEVKKRRDTRVCE